MPKKKKKKKKKLTRSLILSMGRVTKLKLKRLENIRLTGLDLTKKYMEIEWNRIKNDMQNPDIDNDTIIKKYASSDLYKSIEDTNITVRFKQICAKKAIDLIKAICNKQKAREYWVKNLNESPENETKEGAEKRLEKQKNLKTIIQNIWNSPPQIKRFSLELNANCMKFITSTSKHKTWIKINNIFPGEKLFIPYFETKHSKKYKKQQWVKADFLQIMQHGIKCVFNKPIPPKKVTGDIVGCDIGINSVYVMSNFQKSRDEKVGEKSYNLVNLYSKICKKQLNSKACKKAKTHAIQYANLCLNKIDFRYIKELHIEALSNIRWGKKTTPFLRCWRYPLIIQKITNMCKEKGVKVVEIPNAYTSQRCSLCGWVQKSNRKKELFSCLKCKYSLNSDINAAKNLALLNKNDVIKGNSTIGFYYKKGLTYDIKHNSILKGVGLYKVMNKLSFMRVPNINRVFNLHSPFG